MAKTGKAVDKELVSPEGMGSLATSSEGVTGLEAAQTPCELLGSHEVIVHEIAVTRNDRVDWRVFLCNTPARALLTLADAMGHRVTLVNQTLPPPNPLVRRVMPPTPPAARYVLIWSVFPSGADWQMVAEVLVNDVVVFRQFKSANSNEPFPRGFLFVQVL